MECAHSALDLFEPQPSQTSIESGEWVEFRPLSSLNDGPIEFLVRGGSEYLDLVNSYLRVKIKVVNPNNEHLADSKEDSQVVPTNLLLHSLFSEVNVYLNSTQLNTASGAYPYMAYLQTTLTYSPNVKKTQMAGSMYYKDSANLFNAIEDTRNKGMVARKQRIGNSAEVELIGRVHSDIFNQPKYLLSYLDLKLKMIRSKQEFLLLTPKNPDGVHKRYKVLITDASFFVRKLKVSPVVSLAHAKVLEKNNAIYPISKSVMRVFHAPANSYFFQEDNLFLDRIPNKIIIGMVRSEAFNGHYGYNPFEFLHLDLNFLSLFYNGQMIPTRGFQPNFAADKFTTEYMALFNATNTAWTNESCGITLEDFKGGYALYCVDLTPSLAHPSAVLEPQKSGPIRLEARFASPLDFPISIIVYAQFDGHIEITKSREVVMF